MGDPIDHTQAMQELLVQFIDRTAQSDLLAADMEAAKKSLLTSKQVLAMQDIDEEYAPKLKAVKEQLDSLKAQIHTLGKEQAAGGSYGALKLQTGGSITIAEPVVTFDSKLVDALIMLSMQAEWALDEAVNPSAAKDSLAELLAELIDAIQKVAKSRKEKPAVVTVRASMPRK